MLADLVKQKMGREGIGTRETGKRIGVSHVTVARLLNGEVLDIEPMRKFCAWVGVTLSSALDERGAKQDAFLAKIAMLVEREPRLKAILEQAIDDLSVGKLQLEAIEEIIDYAAYKLSSSPKNRGSGGESGNDGTTLQPVARVPASREIESRSVQERH